MYKKDVLEYFERNKDVADMVNRTESAVSQWGEIIPQAAALILERKTRGDLVYDEALYKKS